MIIGFNKTGIIGHRVIYKDSRIRDEHDQEYYSGKKGARCRFEPPG